MDIGRNDTRNHKCDFCEEAFALRTELKFHKKSKHKEDEKFNCKLCDNVYKSQTLIIFPNERTQNFTMMGHSETRSKIDFNDALI